MRGATRFNAACLLACICFNPRAHAGRDQNDAFGYPLAFVSIHAPMRGATSYSMVQASTYEFQSTRPCGARLGMSRGVSFAIQVSIHAPMRGATFPAVIALSIFCCFNPRAHAGRDFPSEISTSSCKSFQSTRPCGARQFC